MKRIQSTSVFALVSTILSTTCLAIDHPFVYVDLRPFPNAHPTVAAGALTDINSDGDVVCTFTDGTNSQVYIWTDEDETWTPIPAITGGSDPLALAMNELGEVCGDYLHTSTQLRRPFRWSPTTGFYLIGSPGYASGINDDSDVIGMREMANSLPAAWLDDSLTLLPPLHWDNGPLPTTARAIAPDPSVYAGKRWMAGQAEGADGLVHPVVWEETASSIVIHDLTPTPADDHWSWDINDNLTVVGRGVTNGQPTVPVGKVWFESSGSWTEIVISEMSEARGLNTHDEVVGNGSLAVEAYLWAQGGPTTPNTAIGLHGAVSMPDDLVSISAYNISDLGEVAGLLRVWRHDCPIQTCAL